MAFALDQQLRSRITQFARYGATGAFVTLLGVAIYWGSAELAQVPPLLANLMAYLGCLVVGYLMHSRWSFPSDGDARSVAGTSVRYAVVSLASVALNSFWVWLLVLRLGGPVWWPILPMIMITPLVAFVLYQSWVFREPRRGPNLL